MEQRKCDKQVALLELIASSLERLAQLCTRQQLETSAYEETEQLAIDEKRKRLHYERIRLQEDRHELKTTLDKIDGQAHQVDVKVRGDT